MTPRSVTFTLCTVPDPQQALSELRRVVRPGGTVHFLEHGLSPDAGVAKWQRRIEPLHRRLADGCHLDPGPARRLVERAGFVMERDEQRYARGPKPWSWLTLGRRRHAPGVTSRRRRRSSEIERGRVPGLVEHHVAGAGDLEGDRPAEATVLDAAGEARPLAVSSATVCSMSSQTSEIS